MSHLYIHLDIQKGQYACSTNHLRCFLLGTTLQWVNLAGLFARDTSFQDSAPVPSPTLAAAPALATTPDPS
ncbi:hypothetical protein RND71_034617 [Anisodus tanguticus]|uniref:Uncharacterized protein n=1 Tax=Anisodus tanguticus TaxID=243964 RepID=A0AAE1UX65_9SOLA|nr:hypothetical protein RND71_034617 [Anisodus tanguticus]